MRQRIGRLLFAGYIMTGMQFGRRTPRNLAIAWALVAIWVKIAEPKRQTQR